MMDWIVIAILAVILGGAAGYMYKAKKSGKKCIGCPDAGSCGHAGCSHCSGCREGVKNPASHSAPR